MILGLVLVLAHLFVSVNSFALVATRHPVRWQSGHFAVVSTDDGGGSAYRQPKLPPGRRTPRFVSLLFDDSLRLLNPKTMGSYQTKRAEQYGDIFKTNIFGKPTIFVTSEEALKLLGKEEARTRSTRGTEAFFPPHHQSLFGQNSLLVQSGETHDRLRRLIQPSLSANLMATVYQPIVEQAMDDFLRELPASSRSGEDDGYIQLVPPLRSFFISIALRILVGKSRGVPPGLADDLTIWSQGLLAPPLTFIPWSTAAKALRARKRICQAMAPLMEQERRESTKDADGNNISLLGRLVAAVDEETGNKLSDEAILDNVLTLIFAGSDTTASAATSMWMVLSLHPDLKERLQNNTDQAESFVEAVLQAYPPAPFSFRLAKEPLSVRGYDIPAGWLVVYGFAGAMAAKRGKAGGLDSFVAPTQAASSSSASASAAFGAGPRMCPGRYLAVLELTTLCQQLVEKYDWKLKPGQNLQQTYTPGFFPKDGLQVKFE